MVILAISEERTHATNDPEQASSSRRTPISRQQLIFKPVYSNSLLLWITATRYYFPTWITTYLTIQRMLSDSWRRECVKVDLKPQQYLQLIREQRFLIITTIWEVYLAYLEWKSGCEFWDTRYEWTMDSIRTAVVLTRPRRAMLVTLMSSTSPGPRAKGVPARSPDHFFMRMVKERDFQSG